MAVAFVAALFLPVFQRAAKVFPKVTLHGAERRIAKPHWSAQSWLNRDFQKRYADAFGQRMGFRGYLIKTWNQLNFSLFRMVSTGRGTQIVIGRDNMLYERVYIRSYNRHSDLPAERLDRTVKEVRDLQDALGRRGIAFVLVIAPSKVEIYPELIPPGILKPDRSKRQSTYERILPRLRKAGIRIVDGHRLFKERKRTAPCPLFPRGGIHWNYYGAGLVVEEVMKEIRAQLDRPIPQLRITGIRVDRTVHGTDYDLGNLLNLWFNRSPAGPQTHPVFTTDTQGAAQRPNLLLLGDSFVHTLAEILLSENLCRKQDTLFYYKRRFVIPRQNGEPIDRDALDWEKELFARDAVIIEINEYWLPRIGFGFIPDALKALRARDVNRQ